MVACGVALAEKNLGVVHAEREAQNQGPKALIWNR